MHTYDVIMIGSGVAGLSVALEFGKRGRRVLVLERGTLASGATSRAAGLIGQMRSSSDAIHLLMDSIRIVREIEARTGMHVLYMSGYSAPDISARGLADSSLTLLRKPFSAGELSDAVRSALASTA